MIDKKALLWSAAPGIGYLITIFYLLSVVPATNSWERVGLIMSVIVVVDILRAIGYKYFLDKLKVLLVLIILYTIISYSVIRWGAIGLVLVVLALALYRIIRNRKTFFAGVKSFDTYLEKWDPKFKEKNKK